MDPIEQILQQKHVELERLQAEMRDAFLVEGDMDFEYAALLYPIIATVEREIVYFQHLLALTQPDDGNNFIKYLQQLLAGEWQSLNIAVDISGYREYSGSVIEIRKTNTRHRVRCTFASKPELAVFLYSTIDSELIQLGWKANRRRTLFHYGIRLKTVEEQAAFHEWISRTLLGPLKTLWPKADRQYYSLNKY